VSDAKPRPVLPNLRLDELLDELQVRLQAVVATRDRVNALFEAVISVGINLDIEVVLRGIVEAAVSLVEARAAGWPSSSRSASPRSRSGGFTTGPRAADCSVR
jgi:hypothetical protein